MVLVVGPDFPGVRDRPELDPHRGEGREEEPGVEVLLAGVDRRPSHRHRPGSCSCPRRIAGPDRADGP